MQEAEPLEEGEVEVQCSEDDESSLSDDEDVLRVESPVMDSVDADWEVVAPSRRSFDSSALNMDRREEFVIDGAQTLGCRVFIFF